MAIFPKIYEKVYGGDDLPKHNPTCIYKDRLIPIEECDCNCYEQWWFELGYTTRKIEELNNG